MPPLGLRSLSPSADGQRPRKPSRHLPARAVLGGRPANFSLRVSILSPGPFATPWWDSPHHPQAGGSWPWPSDKLNSPPSPGPAKDDGIRSPSWRAGTRSVGCLSGWEEAPERSQLLGGHLLGSSHFITAPEWPWRGLAQEASKA